MTDYEIREKALDKVNKIAHNKLTKADRRSLYSNLIDILGIDFNNQAEESVGHISATQFRDRYVNSLRDALIWED